MFRNGVIALSLLVLIAGLAPAQALAQARIGILSLSSPEQSFREWMGPVLARSGYARGAALAVDIRHGTPADLPRLARELVEARPTVLVAVSSAALVALRNASSAIPIVTVGADPVGLGYAQSYSRPGGSVTGYVVAGVDLDAKRLEILHEVVGGAAVLGAYLLKDFPAVPLTEASMQGMAARLGVRLVQVHGTGQQSYQKDVASFVEAGAKGIAVTANPLFFQDTRIIADLATQARLATACEWGDAADRGCLVGYGPDRSDIYEEVARMVVRILGGEKAGDIPIQRPSKFEFVVNLAVAKRLGLDISSAILARADRLVD